MLKRKVNVSDIASELRLTRDELMEYHCAAVLLEQTQRMTFAASLAN